MNDFQVAPLPWNSEFGVSFLSHLLLNVSWILWNDTCTLNVFISGRLLKRLLDSEPGSLVENPCKAIGGFSFWTDLAVAEMATAEVAVAATVAEATAIVASAAAMAVAAVAAVAAVSVLILY